MAVRGGENPAAEGAYCAGGWSGRVLVCLWAAGAGGGVVSGIRMHQCSRQGGNDESASLLVCFLPSNAIGFVYPTAMSIRAIETPQKDDDIQWFVIC